MQGARRVYRQLPVTLAVTLLVVLGPPLAVARLAPRSSTLMGILLCGVLALAVVRGGDWLWRRFPHSRDVLFADLMVWGWVRRLRTERRLAHARTLLTSDDPAERVLALERMGAMIESRDAYTHRHSLRVTRYAEGIARELGLPAEAVARVRTAAVLHDVGKFFTPREILNKPGRLTDAEFAVIKRHPGDGADLVKGIVGDDVVAMIRSHHERLGGTGYPDRLVGDAIPLGARIIAVADTFDAMTSTRAYRKARAHARALTVLREEAGVALDAASVAAFERFYSGRRGTVLSGLATASSPVLFSARELVGPTLARVVPALGTSAVLSAPLLAGSAPALAEVHPSHHRVAVVHHHRHVVSARRVSIGGARVVVPRSGLRHRVAQAPVVRGGRAHAGRPQATVGGGAGGGPAAVAHPTVDSLTPVPTATAEEAAVTPTATHTPEAVATASATAAAPAATPTAAPTQAPDIVVGPVTTGAGGTTIQTPPINVPGLPPIPTVVIKLPL